MQVSAKPRVRSLNSTPPGDYTAAAVSALVTMEIMSTQYWAILLTSRVSIYVLDTMYIREQPPVIDTDVLTTENEPTNVKADHKKMPILIIYFRLYLSPK